MWVAENETAGKNCGINVHVLLEGSKYTVPFHYPQKFMFIPILQMVKITMFSTFSTRFLPIYWQFFPSTQQYNAGTQKQKI